MALVQNDINSKMNDFEATVSFLLTHDPVVNRCTTDWKQQADVSEIVADVGETHHATAKPRVGKTGFETQFHTRPEYSTLSDEQQKEMSKS
jgi:hypothetical protein